VSPGNPRVAGFDEARFLRQASEQMCGRVMQINADFGQRAVRPPPRLEDRVPSPMTGVNR